MVNEGKAAEAKHETSKDETQEESPELIDDSSDEQKALAATDDQDKGENKDEKNGKNGAEKESVNDQNEKSKGKNIPENIKGEVLHVSNISPDTIALDLELLFSKFGKIGYIRMLKTMSGRPYAFVNLQNGDARKCIAALNTTLLKDNVISVAYSKSSPGFKNGTPIHTLSITGAPKFYKTSQYKEFFENHGEVLKVKTIKSYANRYQTLITIESADINKCIKELDQTKIEGKEISISIYTGPTEPREPSNYYKRPEPFLRNTAQPEPFGFNEPFQRSPLLQSPFAVSKQAIIDPLVHQRKSELELKAKYQKMQEERELLNIEKELLLREKIHQEEMRKEALRLEQLREQMKKEKEELEQLYHSRQYSSFDTSQRSTQSFLRNDDSKTASNRFKRQQPSSLPYPAKRNR